MSLEFKVDSCELDVKDLHNATGKVVDAGKQPCALLRVETDVKPELYLSGAKIVKREKIAPGQYYFFISAKDAYVTFGAESYTPYTYKIPVTLEPGRTYKVLLSSIDEFTKNGLTVMFKTTPGEAKLYIDGKDSGLSGNPVRMLKGAHTVKVVKGGFKAIEKSINVDENSIYFDFVFEPLEPVEVNIVSNPADADVIINLEKAGKTPAKLFLIPGNYELKLSKKGYLETVKKIDVKEKGENNFTYTLGENSGFLKLVLIPTDAEVYVDEEDYSGQTRIKLKPGKHTVEIRKGGYFEQTAEVNIVLNQEISKSFTLKENSGVLSLNITPADANVLINKIDYSGKKNIRLTPGQYKMEVLADGYMPQSIDLTIVLGQKVDKIVKLTEQYGAWKFEISPVEAQVVLKRKGIVYKSWTGVDFPSNILTGNYEIEAKAVGYKTKRINFKVTADSLYDMRISMRKGTDIPATFVYVEGGEFTMGRTVGVGDSDELPTCKVRLSSFYMDKYELTVGEFKRFVNTKYYQTDAEKGIPAHVKSNGWDYIKDASWKNPYFTQTDNCPVTCVSWNDAIAYCNWRSEIEGLTPCYTISNPVDCNFFADGYRLATEAEWEYAAKGGKMSHNYEFSGSNNIDEVAWYEKNGPNQTSVVGTKAPNELGLYDMTGNVYEYCWDIYEDYYNTGYTSNDPRGGSSFKSRTYVFRVYRGGCWTYDAKASRNAKRGRNEANFSGSNLGFRIVRGYE